jgi:hypothetical protein
MTAPVAKFFLKKPCSRRSASGYAQPCLRLNRIGLGEEERIPRVEMTVRFEIRLGDRVPLDVPEPMLTGHSGGA